MHEFTIISNNFLSHNIRAFYHVDYVGFQNQDNPDYLNTLKNTFIDCSALKLNKAVQELKSVLLKDLPQVSRVVQPNPLTVCVVPRAKAEATYHPDQLLFKSTIKNVVNQLNGFNDGTNYIIRHTNTKTTHFKTPPRNYNNDGEAPEPGITIKTCNISNIVRDKSILLIDDIYTKSINVDEDAIQALLYKGAHSVIFYSVGRTVYK